MSVPYSKFISLGKKCISADLFKPVENVEYMNKPQYGFWGSPFIQEGNTITSPWVEWCEESGWGDEEYYENAVIFSLKSSAKIFTLDNFTELKQIPKQYLMPSPIKLPLPDLEYYIDYEALAMDYDGMYITHKDLAEFYWSLIGWDCVSIVLFNLDCIKTYEYMNLASKNIEED